MKKILLLAATASLSLLAGLIIASKNIAQTATVAAIVGLPIGIVSYLCSDSRVASERNKYNRMLKENERFYVQKIKDIELKSSNVHDHLTAKNKELLGDIEGYKSATGRFQTLVADYKTANSQLESQLTNSLTRIEQQDTEIIELTNKITSLQSELNEAIRRYEEDLDKEIEEHKEIEITKIEDEHFAFVERCLSLVSTYRSISEQIGERLEVNRNFCLNAVDAHNAKADEMFAGYLKAKKAWDEEKAALGELIERLNEQIAQLQREHRGELTDPVLIEDYGFDQNLKLANALAKEIYQQMQVSLRVTGAYARPDGVIECGYGYSHTVSPDKLVESLRRQSGQIARGIRLHRIVGIDKPASLDRIVIGCRLAPVIEASNLDMYAGTANEFVKYITSHPIRYRLIADPGQGKTPTTAVMVSEILKAGGTRGNTAKGKRISNVLVDVSCPDVISSQKDADYPLEAFLKYGDTTAAIKSFQDAIDDWEYRKQNTQYAAKFFQVWVWDELDNTLNSSDDPVKAGEQLKRILKQAGHTGVGWIVSGQSVMTKQIPGFTNDDRSLFTEIIIGIQKIRKYLEKYGKTVLNVETTAKLLKNLAKLEDYINDKNQDITDDARTLRLALILDDRAPKLYFLPNLDSINFDFDAYEEVRIQADAQRYRTGIVSSPDCLEHDVSNPYLASVPQFQTGETKPAFTHSSGLPHCPHCSQPLEKMLGDGRYLCKHHTPHKKVSFSKVVFK